MTLNSTHILVSVSPSLLKKKEIYQQQLNHYFFASFMVFSLSEKNSTIIFCLRKIIFLQVLDSMPRFKKGNYGFFVKQLYTVNAFSGANAKEQKNGPFNAFKRASKIVWSLPYCPIAFCSTVHYRRKKTQPNAANNVFLPGRRSWWHTAPPTLPTLCLPGIS